MIYFDNSATTYPKPTSVNLAVKIALERYSFNSGRGGYIDSLRSAEKIFEVREKIADMFNFNPENIVFTPNCTLALNMAIKGLVKAGDHIIISSLEHNSVSRVVFALSKNGIIDYDIADYSFDDNETVTNFEKLIKPNTSLIVCMHASNVFGVTFPIEKIGALAKKHNIKFVVDCAQSAGLAKIDAQKNNIDILCAPGHKSLFGPMGTGFMALSNNIMPSTIIEGGTGSRSKSLYQPDFMPDRYESGTLNNAGIIGLGAGIDFINKYSIDNIYLHELSMAQTIYAGLKNINGVKLYTPFPEKDKTMPIVSFNFKDYSSEKTAEILSDNGIACRAGFHCSPLAHKHFKTDNVGTVRISPGLFTRKKECEKFITIVNKL